MKNAIDEVLTEDGAQSKEVTGADMSMPGTRAHSVQALAVIDIQTGTPKVYLELGLPEAGTGMVTKWVQLRDTPDLTDNTDYGYIVDIVWSARYRFRQDGAGRVRVQLAG